MEQAQQPIKKRKLRAILWIAGGLLALLAAVLIHYRGVHPVVRIEYGEPAPQADAFTAREATLECPEQRPSLGRHLLNLRIGGVPTSVLLHVRDTVAPTATPVDCEVALGSSPGPDAFVTDLKDADVVELTFVSTPDFSVESEQTVEIRLKDRSNNRSVVTAHVSVRASHASLTAEAGTEPPGAEAFLLEGVRGALEQPIDAERMRHVGTVRVGILTESGVRSESELVIVDTVAPQAQGTTLLLMPGDTVQPEDCVSGVSDATDLTYRFVTEPDYDRRDVQEVVVRITDEGQNATEVRSTILISGVRPREIEARTEPLRPADFQNAEGDVIDVPPFVPSVPGTYPLRIKTNGVEQTVAITVVDTTAPALLEKQFPAGTVFYTEHVYTPEDFYEASDISGVTLTFKAPPDPKLAGEQTITVLAEDAYGNRTEGTRTVLYAADTEAPRIYGVIDRICYVNEPIAYRKEVFAEDNADGPVEVTVESEVVSNQKGTYRVVYRAVDSCGNEATCECRYTLIDQTVTEEQIHAFAQAILKEITTPDMTQVEVLRAIFDYVKTHVTYTNGVNNNYTDWRKAAYDGITYGKGDCYNIYSATRALLDETDIQYLSVERVKSRTWRTRHYWVHVNVGTGWYCFDPTRTRRHRFDCFMWTHEQCETAERLYWNFDETKYPPLATEPFDYDAVLAAQRQQREQQVP